MMLDDYVVDTLIRDLVGPEHQPTSFLIYLWLSYETARSRREQVPVSYQTIADSVGVSKTAAQTSVRWLVRRKYWLSHFALITSRANHRQPKAGRQPIHRAIGDNDVGRPLSPGGRLLHKAIHKPQQA
jgi:hypothetical protein